MTSRTQIHSASKRLLVIVNCKNQTVQNFCDQKITQKMGSQNSTMSQSGVKTRHNPSRSLKRPRPKSTSTSNSNLTITTRRIDKSPLGAHQVEIETVTVSGNIHLKNQSLAINTGSGLDRKRIVTLQNKIKYLEEDVKTFSDLRSDFEARCEDYASQVGGLQLQLRELGEENKRLNQLLQSGLAIDDYGVVHK